MILVTVGTQLGFDRLIRAMDGIAASLAMPVIAQTGAGTFVPRNMDARAHLDPATFDRLAGEAMLLVSHAGIGSVLTARRLGKPIVLLARRASLGEHRNDHQLATVANLAGRPGIIIAADEGGLPDAIEAGLRADITQDGDSPSLEALKQATARFIAAASNRKP